MKFQAISDWVTDFTWVQRFLGWIERRGFPMCKLGFHYMDCKDWDEHRRAQCGRCHEWLTWD